MLTGLKPQWFLTAHSN